jgi:hypothetical protein
MLAHTCGKLDANIAMKANGIKSNVVHKSPSRKRLFAIWFFWRGIMSCCNFGAIWRSDPDSVLKNAGITASVMSPHISQLALWLRSKNNITGTATSKLTTPNFFLRSNPVESTTPSFVLSFQTCPPWDVTPVEMPPSARTAIVPTMVLANMYKAYSEVGNKRMISIPLKNPRDWINAWENPVMVNNLPHSNVFVSHGLALTPWNVDFINDLPVLLSKFHFD